MESGPLEETLYQVKKIIVGQDALLERMLVALLARGHLLVEGVPGLAKTMAVKALAGAIGGEFQRIQFTSDLVPADVVGTRIYNQRDGEFQVSRGPVFTNLLLADEINRAPAKVQSALLEVMQERQVTIGRETHRVPNPFLVMATQNPIETEGTYPLPEAQVDRFLMKVLVGYPSVTEEFVVVERALAQAATIQRIIDPETLVGLQRDVDRLYVDPSLIEYGSSPRGPIGLVQAAQALALLRGRRHAVAEDVADVAADVLRHRLVLTYDAIGDGVTPDEVLGAVLDRVSGDRAPVEAEAAA